MSQIKDNVNKMQYEQPYWEVQNQKEEETRQNAALAQLSGKDSKLAKLITTGTSAKEVTPEAAQESGWKTAAKIIGHIFTLGIFKLGSVIKEAISESIDQSQRKAIAAQVSDLRDALKRMQDDPRVTKRYILIDNEAVRIEQKDGKVTATIDGQTINSKFSVAELLAKIEDDIVTDVELYGKATALKVIKDYAAKPVQNGEKIEDDLIANVGRKNMAPKVIKAEVQPIQLDDKGAPLDHEDNPQNLRMRELCLKAIKANLGVDAGCLHSFTPIYLAHIAGNAINGQYKDAKSLIDHVLQITTTNRIAADDVQDIMDLHDKNLLDVYSKVNVNRIRPEMPIFQTATQEQVHNFLADVIYSGDILSEDKDFSPEVTALKAEARKAQKEAPGAVSPAVAEYAKIKEAQARELQQAERLRNVLKSNSGVIADLIKIESSLKAVELEQAATLAETLSSDPQATAEQKLAANLARSKANAAQLEAKILQGKSALSQIGKGLGNFFGAAFGLFRPSLDESQFLPLELKAYQAEAKLLEAKIEGEPQENLDKLAKEATKARLAVREARANALAELNARYPEDVKQYKDLATKLKTELAAKEPKSDLGQELDVDFKKLVDQPLTTLDQLPEAERESLLKGLEPESFSEAIEKMLDPFKQTLLDNNTSASGAAIIVGVAEISEEELLKAVNQINEKVEEATDKIQEEMISAILLMDNKLSTNKYAAVRELKQVLEQENLALTSENMTKVLNRKPLPEALAAKMKTLATSLEDINDKRMRKHLLHDLVVKTLVNFTAVEKESKAKVKEYNEEVARSTTLVNEKSKLKKDFNNGCGAVSQAAEKFTSAKNEFETLTKTTYTEPKDLETILTAAKEKLAEAEKAMNQAISDSAAITEGNASEINAVVNKATYAYKQAKTDFDAITKVCSALKTADDGLKAANAELDNILKLDATNDLEIQKNQSKINILKDSATEARLEAYAALGLKQPAEDDFSQEIGANPEAEEAQADQGAVQSPEEQHLQELQNTSLEQLAASASMDFSSNGYGKFLKTAIMNYFKGIPIQDKRSMIASGIRYAPPHATATQMLGAMLKGAGPILQKTFQGLDGPGMPLELRQACKDMKRNLAPIPPDIVEAQLYDMVQSSNGRIKNIEVIESLGAATVVQAFKCRLTDQNDYSREIVVKILRPDVANRAQRERKIFEYAASKVPGMAGTFQGQMRQIMQELDFKIETDNVALGQVYGETFNNVQSVQIVADIPPKSNYMAMELAPGTTLDEYFSTTRKDMATSGEKLGRSLTYNDTGPVVRYSATLLNVDKFKELRADLVNKYKQARARHQQMVNLSEKWVTSGILSPNGFFHGDLHAGNIMSDGTSDKLTVIDFGNATQLNVDQQCAIMTMAVCSGTQQTSKFLKAFRTLLSPEAQKLYDQKEHEIVTCCRAIMEKGSQGDAGQRIMCILSEIQRFGVEIPQEIMNFAFSEMRLQNTMTEMLNLMREIKASIRGIDRSLTYLYANSFEHDKIISEAYLYVSGDYDDDAKPLTKDNALKYLEEQKDIIIQNKPFGEIFAGNHKFRDKIAFDLTGAFSSPFMPQALETNTMSKDPELLKVWKEKLPILTNLTHGSVEATLQNNPEYKKAFEDLIDAICQSRVRILDAIIEDVKNDVTREPGDDQDFLDVMGHVLQTNKKTAVSRLGFIPSTKFAVTSFLNDKFPDYFDPKI